MTWSGLFFIFLRVPKNIFFLKKSLSSKIFYIKQKYFGFHELFGHPAGLFVILQASRTTGQIGLQSQA